MAPLARGRERGVVRRAGPKQLARRALLDDAAADDDDDAVASRGQMHLVQRQQHAALRRRVAPERGLEDVRGDLGSTSVIQRRFNVSVPRARVSKTAPTLRERSER